MSPSSLSPPARTRQFRGADLLPPFSVIFWAGDFNYRIELPNEDARELATSDNLHHLVVADQVRPLQTPYSSALEVDRCLLSLVTAHACDDEKRSLRRLRGGGDHVQVSSSVVEGEGGRAELTFPRFDPFRPTYKYDNGTDSGSKHAVRHSEPGLHYHASPDYDTSEKARVPAYTDRVLWRGSSVSFCSRLRPLTHSPDSSIFFSDRATRLRSSSPSNLRPPSCPRPLQSPRTDHRQGEEEGRLKRDQADPHQADQRVYELVGGRSEGTQGRRAVRGRPHS